MHLWQLACVVYFLYIAILAVWRGPEPVEGRSPESVGGRSRDSVDGPSPEPVEGRRGARRAFAGAACGLVLTFASSVVHVTVLNDWILPPALLLIGYWSSGFLFVAPRPSQEAALRWLDDRVNVPAVAARTPRALAEVFESAYAGVYILIPIALVIHLTFAPQPNPDKFWAIVLVTDFICFAVLPWIQTRPPRALETGDPWSSSVRAFNLRMLGATSIQVNTFPSGHAAEGLAAALLVTVAPPAIVAAMFAAGLAVSAGAVLGRYHYLVDALAGWVVAVVVFAAIGN